MRGLAVMCLMGCCGMTVLQAQEEDFRTEYEKFRKETRHHYGNFRRKANADYADFVSRAWEEFRAQPAIAQPKETPVPPVVIPDDERSRPNEDKALPDIEVVTLPPVPPQPQPQEAIPEQPRSQPSEQWADFRFYGTEMRVRWHPDLRFALDGCREAAVSKGWKMLSGSDYDNLLHDCLALRAEHCLCDWAYLCMLRALSQTLLGGRTNEATLLLAYLYAGSGYQMRLARQDGRLCMLYGSHYRLYDQPYFLMDGEPFYPLDCRAKDLSVCNASYPGEQPLALQMRENPLLTVANSESRLLTANRYEQMSVAVTTNRNLMDYYTDYPASQLGGDFMTKWAAYADTPLSEETRSVLYPSLRSLLQDLSPAESVERLLNWVQTAFAYEYDDKVWGADRAFFAEETLYYPYCDCEDRSILLTRLVRDLLHLKCALVYYPGHLATAIALDETVKGDYLMLSGRRYVICDPTYIGAPVGRTMPNMDNQTAKVMVLND